MTSSPEVTPVPKQTTTSMSRSDAPFIIGIAGGPGAGKKAACQRIMEELGGQDILQLSLHDFYRPLTEGERVLADQGNFNFDLPDAFDFTLLQSVLEDLKMGRQTILPKYDFAQHAQSANPKVCHSTPTVVLLEGILVLFPPRIRELLDMKVFLHVDDDTRLSRRCLEKARGPQAQSLEFILDQYIRFVKPAFTDYALPTKNYADIIVPIGDKNAVAIDLIVQHIRGLLHALEQRRDEGSLGVDGEGSGSSTPLPIDLSSPSSSTSSSTTTSTNTPLSQSVTLDSYSSDTQPSYNTIPN
ncbi:MAG: uridine cytidine kinase i [Piptocephalis tieghemiana]|nr:MAG: uridine cytidine kinase i [Piptocephalis tieghemiana]